MKKTYFSVKSLINSALGTMLALLGFSCSSEEEDDDNILLMYGSPTGYFQVKGSVTDEDGAPIDSAEIILRGFRQDDNTTFDIIPENYKRVITDKDGKYTYFGSMSSRGRARIVCKPLRPGLEADSAEQNFDFIKDEEKHKGEWWYFGEAHATQDFKLKKK